MPKQTPGGRGPGWSPSTARAPDGPASLHLRIEASEFLFDLGGLLQAVDVSLELLLHDGVGQLSFHLVERRIARVFELDDVPAVLGLYGFGGEFAFLQELDGITKRFDHARSREPTEIAAIRLRIVGGFGFCDVLELCPTLDFLDELL